ncbi:AAA ATPase domain-containing protein [Parafrankia irregularis]|uniref:AAA ATPase domain-containing protein n=1 Tax=Parafrankia irregularis TaxID=795642 RepID=A0A0S4QVH3_9ACTN|nr:MULTISPECIES: winged helix-turn-helix domain-containing protein [Parafrankia]CUU59585.1 AAA ATPase domain-containing protein [Parafrankia irregularis]
MTAESAPPRVIPARFRPPPAARMRRERLTREFAGSPAYRVGLVVAPAGAGKSTLLAEIAQHLRHPTAWLTLDDRIGTSGAFLAHLQAAVRNASQPAASQASPAAQHAPAAQRTPATWASSAEGTTRAGQATERPWTDIEMAITDLEQRLRSDLLIVLDDLHTVQGQPAEAAAQTFLDYLPSHVRVLVSARWRPDLDLHRLRLAGRILELDADALRFRVWEVEELFRDCHGVRLRPDEVAALTRSTSGWAAGLQLFHLATSGRPQRERARILSGLAKARVVREYLTTHVLDTVRPEERDFLIRTCVFDRLTDRRCDDLLGRTGSDAQLAGLERRGLFTVVDDDGISYRYHEVLRMHLLAQLVDELGEAGANEIHRTAATLCERDGALSEAVLCYCRCGDWKQVRRLLEQGGERLAEDPADWFELLPPSIRDSDPWVLLAVARRLTANGSLNAAADAYRGAVAAFGPQAPVWVAREQAGLDDWRHPALRRTTSWSGMIRKVLEDPGAHIDRPTDSPQALLASGIAAFVGGRIPLARRRFDLITDGADGAGGAGGAGGGPVVEAVAAIGSAACAMLMADEQVLPDDRGDRTPDDVVDAAMAAAERLGYPAFLRVATGIRAMRLPTGHRRVLHLLNAAEVADDQWGSAILRLIGALVTLTAPPSAGDGADAASEQALAALALAASVRHPAIGGLGETAQARMRARPTGSWAAQQAAATLETAARDFDELSAPALATWARVLRLIAGRHTGTALPERETARTVRAAARIGPAPYALALAGSAPSRGAGHLPDGPGHASADEMAARIAADAGIGPLLRRLTGAHDEHGGTPTDVVRPAVGPPTPATNTTADRPARNQPAAEQPAAGQRAAVEPGPPNPRTAASGRLTIRCLGGFEISRGGTAISLDGVQPRNLELLHILAVHADRAVSRDRLTELIWPDASPSRANHSLQVAISALRGLLEPDVPREQRRLLRRAGQGYLLVVTDHADHDLLRFGQLLTAADEARQRGDRETEADHLMTAIERHGGELLPAGRPTDWLLTERERLRVVLATACERVSRLLTEAGRHAEAARLAERGLDVDRYRDGLWQVLALALRANGQPAAAALAEVRYRSMLAELGVSDGPGDGPGGGDGR